MAKSRPAFHLWMILLSGGYLCLALWAKVLAFRLIAVLVGEQRFGAWEEATGTLTFWLWGGWITVNALATLIDLVLWCLLSIPLYCLWAAIYRRRDRYLEAIGGKSFDEHH
jgi:NADH:ubiquinone oxidoreductase subunit 2 (subunit N)